MSCYFPLPAMQQENGNIKIGRYSSEHPYGLGYKIELPCGRCVGCRKDKARTWSIRAMHEAQLYDSNLFVTLDYKPTEFDDDGNRKCGLPPSLSLEYGDFQLFMKRLRKTCSGVSVAPNGTKPIRFFVSGEYGEKYQRPHWHALLFNCHFDDMQRFVNGTYRSSCAERLWGHGQVVIGMVTPESAAYCAGYTLSKVYGRAAEDHYEDVVSLATGEVTRRRAEFCQMSRDPGIGSWWYEKYGRDLFPHDFAVSSGRKYKVPRYYWEKFRESAQADVVEVIAESRRLRAAARPLSESSEERRAIRAEVAKARLNMYGGRDH